MTISETNRIVSRRAALAGMGAGLGFAVAIGPAAARQATPGAMSGHPLVGTWIMDFGDGSAPVINAFTSDGIFVDAGFGITGVWESTGPTSGAFTWALILQEEFSGYLVVSGEIEVDQTGDAWTNTFADTTVAADGTVIDTGVPSTATAKRLRIAAAGEALTGMPSWTPAPPPAATPSD
jgi:hypothetical protein